MAENLKKVPKRGILKQSTSFEQRTDTEEKHPVNKEPHFDENNILETLHPADKDYGFMKIEEPKTPFGQYESDEEGGIKDDLDANLLAARIEAEGNKGPRPRRISEPSADEEDLESLTPEDLEKKKQFMAKRRTHYNEYYAVKMARQLMQEDEEEEEEADCEKESEAKHQHSGSNSPMDTAGAIASTST